MTGLPGDAGALPRPPADAGRFRSGRCAALVPMSSDLRTRLSSFVPATLMVRRGLGPQPAGRNGKEVAELGGARHLACLLQTPCHPPPDPPTLDGVFLPRGAARPAPT